MRFYIFSRKTHENVNNPMAINVCIVCVQCLYAFVDPYNYTIIRSVSVLKASTDD